MMTGRKVGPKSDVKRSVSGAAAVAGAGGAGAAGGAAGGGGGGGEKQVVDGPSTQSATWNRSPSSTSSD